MFDIDRRGRSIFLADVMNAGRIAKGYKVFVERLLAEGTLAERVMEDSLGRAEQIILRERLLLRQQNPGPVGLSETRIGSVPCFQDRNHVEHGEPLHMLRLSKARR